MWDGKRTYVAPTTETVALGSVVEVKVPVLVWTSNDVENLPSPTEMVDTAVLKVDVLVKVVV